MLSKRRKFLRASALTDYRSFPSVCFGREAARSIRVGRLKLLFKYSRVLALFGYVKQMCWVGEGLGDLHHSHDKNKREARKINTSSSYTNAALIVCLDYPPVTPGIFLDSLTLVSELTREM